MIVRRFKRYSADPLQQLQYADGGPTPIVLRRIENLTADAGSGASFDTMLSRWVGALNVTGVYWLMNIPPGTYDLYLYSGSTVPTRFTVMVNGGAYVVKSTTPTGAVTFVANDNYVKFPNLVVPYTKRAFTPEIWGGGMLEIRVEGTLSGLQLKRV